MRDRQLQVWHELGEERVRERLILPAGAVRLLRLLEVIADPAGADTQELDLARLSLAGGVAGRRLQLGLEVLGQPQTDRLLWVGPGVERVAGRVDGARKRLRHAHAGGVLIADLRGKRMPDARQRAEPGEEAEERR